MIYYFKPKTKNEKIYISISCNVVPSNDGYGAAYFVGKDYRRE